MEVVSQVEKGLAEIYGGTMKQSNITPKIIELSKQIAEHWRMKFYIGCWIEDDMKNLALIEKIERDISTAGYRDSNRWFSVDNPDITPIPSIEDCLERLREQGLYIRLIVAIEGKVSVGKIGQQPFFETEVIWENEIHEALLTALLEVLKGESQDE